MQKLTFTNSAGDSIEFGPLPYGVVSVVGLSETGLNIQEQVTPMQDGTTPIDQLIEPRDISLVVKLCVNTLAERYEARRDIIKTLNPKLGVGTLTYQNDYITKEILALPYMPVFPNHNANDAGTASAQITFHCHDPYWRDTTDTVVSLVSGAAGASIDLDTDIPVPVDITITGITENPKVTELIQGIEIEYDDILDATLDISTRVGNKTAKLDNSDAWRIRSFGTVNAVASDGFVTIAVGTGFILLSVDGLEWKAQFFSGLLFSTVISTVFFDGVFFVLSTNAGIFYSSENGVDWVQKGTVSGFYPRNIKKINGSYIAVGDGGKIYTSSDLTTWTPRTSGTTSTLWSVSHNGTTYIVTAQSGIILKSTDIVTWTSQTVSTYVINGSSSSGSLTVLSGISGLWSSTDLTTWTKRSTLAFIDVFYKNGTFVACGYNGRIASSTNGIDWDVHAAVTDNYYLSVTFGKDKYIAAGQDGVVVTSSDLTTWTPTSKGVGVDLISVSKINELFITASNSSNIFTSSDLKTWNKTVFGLALTIRKIKKINGSVFTVGDTGLILKTNNGTTFEQITSGTTSTIYDIDYGNGFYIIVGEGGMVKVSEDLITWNSVSIGISTTIYSICFSQFLSIFVCASTNDAVYTSRNGTSWDTIGIAGSISQPSSIAVSADYVVISIHGSTGKILFSQDGDSWTYKTITSTYGLRDISFNGEKFLITGTNGSFFSSSNIDDWHVFVRNLKNEQKGIYSDSDGIITVGDTGVITSSSGSDLVNVIDRITPESDMALSLQPGSNALLLTCDNGTAYATITYRKRYIGL